MHLRYCNYHMCFINYVPTVTCRTFWPPFVSPHVSSRRFEARHLSVFIVRVLPSLRGKGLLWRACGEFHHVEHMSAPHMSNSCPASHESLHRWVLNACSWCLACLTCQVPLRSSFWFPLNDGSLDAPCEDATFSIRQEPAADRPLSWWSARAARPHCACCQDRRLPFTSTHGVGTSVVAT